MGISRYSLTHFIGLAMSVLTTLLLGCETKRIVAPFPVYEDPKKVPEDPGLTGAHLLIVEGATHNFANRSIGSTTEVTLTLYNNGVKDATAIAIANNLALPFRFKTSSTYPGAGGTCGATLAAGSSCDIVIEFVPVAGGTFAGSFTLSYQSEDDDKEFSFGVIGSAGSASVTTDRDPSYTFANTLVGSSRDVTVTLTNGGALAARFLADSGLTANPFSYKGGVYPGSGGTCGVELEPGASCTVVLTYSPTTAGTHIGAWGVGFLTGGSAASASLALQGTSGLATLEFSDAPQYDFGNVFLGATSSRSITVSNTGNYEATMMADGGALSGNFSFVGGTYPGSGGGTCGATLAAGASCVIVVQFAPSVVGAVDTDLEIDYFNGQSTVTASMELRATGRGAVLEMDSGTWYNFHRVAKNSTTDATLTLRNTGNHVASAISYPGGMPAVFRFKGFAFPGTGGTCTTSLAAGASCTLVIQYIPTGTGTALISSSGTLTLNYNNGGSSTSLATTLLGEAGLGSITISNSFNFGTRAVGSTTNFTATVTNNGTFDVTSLAWGTPFAAPFMWTTSGSYPGASGTCGAEIAPGGSCTVRISFSPSSIGVFSDTLYLDYNNGESVVTASRAMSGTGALAVLSITDMPLYDFGPVAYNSNFASRVITITNTGGISATAFTRTGLAAPFTIFSQTCGSTLAAGASCNVTLRYTPTSLGASAGAMNISYNNGQSVQNETLNLQGQGINTAPVASGASYSVPQDDPGTVFTLPATDANGNPLSYSIVTAPSHGTLGAVVGNTVMYTPDPSYNGADSFTFQAYDGMDFSNTATISITVTP